MRAREKRFCEEYLLDLNAPAAAIRAGYDPEEAEGAGEWLDGSSPNVRKGLLRQVRMRMAARSARTGITADRVLTEYARIAFANIGDLVQGEALREDISADDMAAVASIRAKGARDYDIKMYDKLKALEVLTHHLGMDVPSGTGPGEMPTIKVYADGSAERGT